MAASTAFESHPDVSFDVAIDSTHRTLRPSGEIDMATAPILLEAAGAFMSTEVGDVTIDLAGVTFADSALLHALIVIRNDLRAQGAGLWLVNELFCAQRLFLASGFRPVLAR